VVACGKFFHLEGSVEAFGLRGVSYGPFSPETAADVDADFARIASLGFNAVRVHELPAAAMLAAAEKHGLRLICGVPWAEHVDFLGDAAVWQSVRRAVVEAARFLAPFPCVAALLVGNEIEKTLVRWMRPQRVRAALEELIALARAEAPQLLVSYATYPSTEYLVPRNADFLAVNVYLERREDYARYLARLHNLAGNKPMVISEFGVDTAAQGEAEQAAAMRWWHAENLAAGVAGAVWFSFTDEWFRGGGAVTRWQFGLTTSHRQEKAACAVARDLPAILAPPARAPRFSVIVCTRNGARTLQTCLQSLQRLNYPDYEVIVVDDGSTDATAQIAQAFPEVKYHKKAHAGLSAARNRGAELANGEIVAFTDDDCQAHPDWLLHLSHAFAEAVVLAAGGPNIPPTPRNRVERVVAAAPGAPAHVLMNDTEAEHLPGCNLAVRKSAMAAIGGFDVDFTVAGDDVDFCWRLREHGGRGSLRFVPAAMVWHHRRFTVRAYLRQQSGYGDAEALLMAAHPARFGPLGGARWLGGIYGDHLPADDPREGSIFHGALGLGAFQTIYAAQGAFRWWDWLTGLIWLLLALVALLLGAGWSTVCFPVFAMAAAWRVAARNGRLCGLNSGFDFMVLSWLCFLQPVVREMARVRGMITHSARPTWQPVLPEIIPPLKPRKHSLCLATRAFWSSENGDRHALLDALVRELERQRRVIRLDDGWRWHDIEVSPQKEVSRAFLTVTEYHGNGRCLTRVRCLLRLSRAAVWNVLLWVAFTGLLAAWAAPVKWFGWTGLALTFATLFFGSLKVRGDLIRLLERAAEQAKLQKLGSEEPSRPESPV
jgi:hypothetical protein